METEYESVAKALFRGQIETNGVFPFPTIPASETETLELVTQSLRAFLKEHIKDFPEFDRAGEQPDYFISKLKELGLFGLIIPESAGGMGLSSVSYARVLQEITQFDGATALTVGAHSSIGMKGVLLFGTSSQRERYLPLLASGEMIAAFCLTEPSSGSDAASIRTKVHRVPSGGYLLTGEKIWITNGAFADFFTVFARHQEDETKLSAFIVERGWGGVVSGKKEDKLGIRGSATTSISFQDTKLPAEALLGEEGEGFRIAMAILNSGRTGLGGGCVGAMRRAIRLATNHATERVQFGKKLIEFPIIQDKLAEMTTRCFAAESVVQVVGYAIDSDAPDYSVEAAISKIYASESLWYVANEALQIAGGNGFMKEYPYEMILRDSRINMIFEGTNEILRLYVALAGVKGVGEYLKELMTGLSQFPSQPARGLEVLVEYATKKLSRVLPQEERLLVYLDPRLHREGKVITAFAARLGHAAEKAVREHRSTIIHQQLTLVRLADCAIELFTAMTVLSRVTALLSSDKENVNPLLALARSHTQGAKRKVAASLRRLVRNEDTDRGVLAQYLTGRGGEFWGA